MFDLRRFAGLNVEVTRFLSLRFLINWCEAGNAGVNSIIKGENPVRYYFGLRSYEDHHNHTLFQPGGVS